MEKIKLLKKYSDVLIISGLIEICMIFFTYREYLDETTFLKTYIGLRYIEILSGIIFEYFTYLILIFIISILINSIIFLINKEKKKFFDDFHTIFLTSVIYTTILIIIYLIFN